MSDLIRREDAYAAIRGLTRHIDRIAAIRALPAVSAKHDFAQPDAAVLHMTITGLNITVVKSGTVVGKDDEGNDMLVTDETTVFNGWRAWVTQKVYDALKGETP